MTQEAEPLVSIVVPIYNEIAVVEELLRRLRTSLADTGRYEVVVVDDGSTDGSWDYLRSQVDQGLTLRLIRLSRNFGHQVAISAGLDVARGDAVVIMDGDLQHPPELIPALVAKWREGYDVVYTVRTERGGEAWFKRTTGSLFYRVMGRMSEIDMPAEAGDFRLLSRRAADALAAMPERARFLRGMVSWIGYRQVAVPYRGERRPAGQTKYPFRRMVRLAADALTSFSAAPLRLVSALGLSFVVFCGAYLVYVLYVRFFTDRAVAGWTAVVVLILLIGGLQLLSLGIVGQYVARIFDESKQRPLYLVDEFVDGADEQTAEPGDRGGHRHRTAAAAQRETRLMPQAPPSISDYPHRRR